MYKQFKVLINSLRIFLLLSLRAKIFCNKNVKNLFTCYFNFAYSVLPLYLFESQLTKQVYHGV